ncbi:unnamed protein product [Phaedon cochleariae]|uniref:BZIP domain-containing protein n=1 Tax=Phaedon cochleariae TaxID=80249 RepID=A0A9P0DG15_PHACE|nr:unnamed protein product [Phaedon cochleariae]
MNINDLLNSSGEEANSDMETMDVSLNCDDPELMSSEFFDSVLSLENNMDDVFFSKLEDDINLSSDVSSHLDEVLSPQSYYSESDKNSTSMESLDESGTVLGSMDQFDDTLLMSMFDSAPEYPVTVKKEPEIVQVTTPVQKQPTQILIQNPNNKKCISKPMLTASQIKNATPLKVHPQILKVQPISTNGSPLLVPLNIKSFKILNAPINMATFGNIRKRKIEHTTAEQIHVKSSNQYPSISLTQEEKRLLAKEGIQLPTHHPLTKTEERELKRIRRKIRNKISAQDSRKRKKEYVDGLEERVRVGSQENRNLLQRVRALQKQNKTLIAHVNKLQALICNSTTSKATPSTCLMVVLLSALLVSLPNMKLFDNKPVSNEQEQVAVRRSLLSSPTTAEDALNMEEFLVFKDEEDYDKLVADMENSTDKEISKMLEEMGKKYDNLVSDSNNNSKMSLFSKVMETVQGFLERGKDGIGGPGDEDYGGYRHKRGFIEPDIDEYEPGDGPPLKRGRMDADHESVVTTTTTTTTVKANNLIINVKDK